MTRDPPPSPPRWRLRLLGAVLAEDGGVQRIERFPSRAVAALLARLALWPQRAHAREELVELLWPGVALAVGRNRLRQALSVLKSLLEPAGLPGHPVLQADRQCVRVVPGALGCDVHDFERLCAAGRAAEARAQYGGEFMPGHYEEWIHAERQRLAALHEGLPVQGPAPPGAAAAAAPAPPAPRAAAPKLPSYLTRLFGAGPAATRLRALVQAERLVTLLGPGGGGKTRLAVEVAAALSGSVPGFDRVAFVPLVTCSDGAQMLDALWQALQLPGAADAGVAPLAALLSGQRVLLVLDNFEQLVGRAEGLLAEMLSLLPALHLLVTSRRALGLDGEHCTPAQPLPLPAPEAALAQAAANPAVALFVDRARAARADFHLGERNHAAIVALVRRLDGLPLAIELAASRVRSFPPAEMVALLGTLDAGAHLALLSRSGPRSGHDPRHAAMTEVIAWSWRLLEPAAQQVLVALTLFPASATSAALAAVAGLPRVHTAMQLDSLVAHSLVRAEDGADGAARFGLVEPVREFAAAQLAPDAALALRARLRAGLLDWALALGPAPSPTRVAPEMATVHAALDTAQADGAGRQALALALALRSHWDTDGLPARLQARLEAALASLPEADVALRADAHELLAYLRFEAGFAAAAQAHAAAALALAPDAARRARALVRQAWVALAAGRNETGANGLHASVRAALDEALALARASGDREVQARALHQQAALASQSAADPRQVEALLEESQALWLALGDRRKAQARLRNRAQCWVHMGRAADALACFQACEQSARDDGDWVGQIDSLLSLATLLAHQRQWQPALDANQRCLALCWQRWHRHGLAYALWMPPRLLARLRRPEPAMRLMAFAAAFWAQRFGPLGAADRRELRRVRGLVRAQVGAARAEQLWREGEALEVAAAVALALQA
jgi:predicted ATPase